MTDGTKDVRLSLRALNKEYTNRKTRILISSNMFTEPQVVPVAGCSVTHAQTQHILSVRMGDPKGTRVIVPDRETHHRVLHLPAGDGDVRYGRT